MSLESREAKFAEISDRFDATRYSSLISGMEIDEDLFNSLEKATCAYMSASMPEPRLMLNELGVLHSFRTYRSDDLDSIKNCTPNGMLVPKRNLTLEYNAIVKAYAAIIDSLGINDFIHSWHIPLNLRYKDGDVVEANMTRHHPTEHIHTDSWAGESPGSVTTMIPILGDTDNNYVKFFQPPANFQEDWLGPRDTYLAGADIAKQYTKIEVPYKKGHILLADFATLHSSSRNPGSEARVSIDTTFAVKRSAGELEDAEVRMHGWRKEERATPETLSQIGNTKLFYFPHTMDEQVDSRGGFKHPTNLVLVDLLNQ